MRSRNPEVVLIGRLDGGLLFLPWDADQPNGASRLHLEAAASVGLIACAEHEEFVRGNLPQAAVLYRRGLEETQSPIQKAYARLSLARILMKLGRAAEAIEQYRNILTLSPSVADECGAPLSFYACKSLFETGAAHADVLNLVRTELHRSTWIAPAASYLLRELVDADAGSAPEKQVRSDAMGLPHRAAGGILY